MTFQELMQLKDYDILDYLREQKIIHRDEVDKHRWYGYVKTIVETDLDDAKYVLYVDCIVFGDNSAEDAGWQFEKQYVRVVNPTQKVITVYE